MARVSSKGLIMTSVYLSAAQRERLKKIGQQRGISAAEVLRQILDAGLDTKPAVIDVAFPARRAKKPTVIDCGTFSGQR